MVYFQQSLFGKTSWERYHQITGWILEPSYPLSQTPMFQCLLLEDGQEPEWCEGERLTSAGGSWTPNIGQAPDWHDGSASFLWQTLEDGVPTKYFLSPAQCSHFLHLAEIAGCPPPAEIEALLLKQGGAYQSPYEEFFITAFDGDVMGLYDYLTEYENLDELNHLAHLISELDSDEIETLEAALNKGDHTSSVADIINLVHNLDCYDLHPGVTDDEMLGRIYVEDMELLDVPDNVLPYVFIGWAFLKLGTAYRLAVGSDFAHKFIGLGQTVGAAFADFAPGLAPFDWLVGNDDHQSEGLLRLVHP